MWTCVGVLTLIGCAAALSRDQFYPFGHGLDLNLPRGKEVPSPEIPLKVPIVFYGETYESIFVNNYGVLTFRADMPSFLNIEFPLPYSSIAPFYTNIDTSEQGTVFYRETNENHVLSKAEESVQNNFHEYYDFKPTSVFVATWLDVTYSNENQKNTPTNSFQVAVITNGTESFAEFLYPEREIQWYQRETQPVSLPDAKAQAGFVSEDGRMFTLRGSGSHQIRNIVSWSNTHEPGKYIFRIGVISPEENIAVPDQYNQNEIELEEESKTCAQSGPSVCHMQARCVDYQAGICCQCNEGFYGNGKTCIKDDVPLRAHGKINGVINDINLNDVDIQAYVVVAEGRAYTALSLIPRALGNSLQFLNALGGVIGWIFAKPLGTAKNGYQLTGSVFNHTADIWFPATGERVVVNQEYLGQDVFDQIILETDIRGSLPVILTGTKLEVREYDEQYSLVEPGLIRSESTRTFINKITGEQYEQRVSQTFKFSSCRFAPLSKEDTTPYTLKVIKNYLGYENVENIVRYGMTNKIFPLGQEDPCIKGRSSCGPHSSCVAQGDSFVCVCQSGFTDVYQENVVVCIDVDECRAGTHNCDNNADCYNYNGGFQCKCRPGFIGNGISCTRHSGCETIQCHSNAQCITNANGESECVCNSGFNGNGQVCYQNIESACADCASEASCEFSYEYNSFRCTCKVGYFGDGYRCIANLPPTENLRSFSPATENSNEAEYNDTFVLPNCDSFSCTCPPGYSHFRDDLNNQLCRLDYHDQYEANYAQSPNLYDRPPERAYPTPSESMYPPQTESNLFTDQQTEFNPSSTESYYRPTETTYPTPSESMFPPRTESNLFTEQQTEFNPSSTESYYRPTAPKNTLPQLQSKTPDWLAGTTYQSPDNEYQPPQSEVNDTLISCEDDTDCPPNAVCLTSDDSSDWDVKHCVCPEGYEGDAYECIERTSPECACGINAHCVSTGSGDFTCVCDSGYRIFDGYSCRPALLSCRNDTDCEYNAECKPDARTNENVCQCVQGYIKDQNEACIPDAQLCNGASCVEHASCLYDPDIDLNYCHCNEGYTGDAIVQCQPAERTCDVLNDCDYNAVCTPHGYTHQCVCREGFAGDGYNCVADISCRTDPTLCDPHASCQLRNEAYVCECNIGYNGDGSSCQLNPRQAGNHLVVSDGSTVYRVPFHVTPRDTATAINSDTFQTAVALDVDCDMGWIYWGDVGNFAIKRAAYDGSGYEQFLSFGVKNPEGIAVDWASRNVFWTDSKKLTIEVANLDTRARKVLFAIEGISNPRGIAAHPQRGKIFWSDWKRGNPKIEWANMDGSQRGIFLDKSEVALPNSLAIDWQRDRLCFADAGLASIKCVEIDSLKNETIATNCPYPFGLSIMNNKFYWTDWKTLMIEFIDIETKVRGKLPIGPASRRLFGVAVAPEQCPHIQSFCSFRNGGCSLNQLCLPDGQGGRTCVEADKTFENENVGRLN